MSQCVVCHPTDFSSTNSLRIHNRPAPSGHTNCAQCHAGTPGPGNVTADKCVVCHPQGNPGACNLVDLHSPNITSSCLDCHMNCAGGSPVTTTTTAPVTTTTIPGGTTTTTTPATTTGPVNYHFDICLTCHLVDDLHAKAEHNYCFQCHTGTPSKGNVDAEKCIGCHPIGNRSTCNLVTLPEHGNSCVSCHLSCTEGSTTSTTTIPQGECQIISIAPPSGVKIGFGLIPRIRRITLTTNSDLDDLGITGSDFIFVGNPRGITILSSEVFGNSIEARVLFWGTRPNTYNITLGECGSTSIVVSRFGNNNTLAIENVISRFALHEPVKVTRSEAPRKYAGLFSFSRMRNLIKSFF